MNVVAIVGVGLIGGSFGLALREAGFEGDLIGVSSPAALDAALNAGAIDRGASLADAAAQADLLYLAQPVDRILATLGQLQSLAAPHCLVTDAGSTKTEIVQRGTAALSETRFLGGHPMAGKETRGAEAAEASLFRGRPYILTPQAPATPASADFRFWLRRIGANVIDMSPEEHDATVAFSSHLPQLISSALALTLARENNPRVTQVFGSGLVDMTRLALSTPELWDPILSTNKLPITVALDAFIESLLDLKTSLGQATLVNRFEIAGRLASTIRKLSLPARSSPN